jgi:hypothetical protein
VLTQQLAGECFGKKIRGLINWKAVRAVVSSHTSAPVGRFLADCLGEAQPPGGQALSVIVVEQFKNGITGEG